MTDEFKLNQDAAKADRAKQLLDDEMLKEAFSTLEAEYTKALFLTHVDASNAREKLFLAVNVLRKVRDHLSAVVSNGSLAHRELREIAEAAERKKKWADV